jgi:hypothetical protein
VCFLQFSPTISCLTVVTAYVPTVHIWWRFGSITPTNVEHPVRFSRRLLGLPPLSQVQDLPPIMADPNPGVLPHAVPHRSDRHIRLDSFDGNEHDARRFLKDFERYSQCCQWDDILRLGYVSFFLKGNARLWYDNNEDSFVSWEAFQTKFKDQYVQEHKIREDAKKELRQRSQRTGESCNEYVQVVIKLCRDADPEMTEEHKVGHVLKGIAESVYVFLVLKEVTSIAQIIDCCRKLDATWSKRLPKMSPFARLPTNIAFPVYPDESIQTPTIAAVTPDYFSAPKGQLENCNLEEVIFRVVKKVVKEELLSANVATVAAATQFSSQEQRPSNTFGSPELRRRVPRCYFCNQLGHIQRFCYHRTADSRYNTNNYSAARSGYFNRNDNAYIPPRFRNVGYNASRESPSYEAQYPPYNSNLGRRASSQSPNPRNRGRSPYRSGSPYPINHAGTTPAGNDV